MLLPNQWTKMRWHSRNKDYYTNRGYAYTKMGDEFDVRVEDLPSQSHAYVKVQCDYCGVISLAKYQNYNNRSETDGKCACKRCKNDKAMNTFKQVYNVDNPFQLDSTIEKSKQTCLEKYGVERYQQTQEFKDTVAQTCLEKYGSTCYITSEEGKERIKKINNEKFGRDYPFGNPEITKKLLATQEEKYGGVGMASPEVREKIQQTNLEKYGNVNPLQLPEIKAKARQTLYKNGTCPVSRPQIALNNLLKEMYGNAELNYPVGALSLDSYVNINGIKIDVEYDGWYWHQNTGKKDYQRDYVLRSLGYKILRVKGCKEIPTKEEIEEAINYLLEDGHCYTKIIKDIKEKI